MGRRRGLRTVAGLALAAAITAAPSPARAQTAAAPASGDRPFTLRWSFKGTGAVSQVARDGLARVRVEPTIRLGRHVTFESAYEQRVRVSTGGGLPGGLGVLPSEAPASFRVTPLDWAIAAGARSAWRHEIDRAALRVESARVTVVAGRQAVGWGRGVLFGAIDLFAPFSPFEADREWRRGIDAVRVDARLSNRASADVVVAVGPRPSASAYAARVRGYAGTVDVEAVGGRRGGDWFGGAASSFVVGGGEVHVEAAAFRVPAVPGSARYATTQTVVKAVVGGSSRVSVGHGIAVWVEYHYSGFGVRGAREMLLALADPAFAARYARGDTQMLTRHAVAAVASYEWSPIVAGSASVVHDPTDGSGVVTPSLTLTFGDRWSLLASAYVPYGRTAVGGVPRTAYGSAPYSGLVQIRLYR